MPKAYQLRIALRDFKPAIYRDVLVSPATPLPKLHKLIQAAMGWDNAHMHGFALPKKNERYYSVPLRSVYVARIRMPAYGALRQWDADVNFTLCIMHQNVLMRARCAVGEADDAAESACVTLIRKYNLYRVTSC